MLWDLHIARVLGKVYGRDTVFTIIMIVSVSTQVQSLEEAGDRTAFSHPFLMAPSQDRGMNRIVEVLRLHASP